jgi:hypothetical protein
LRLYNLSPEEVIITYSGIILTSSWPIVVDDGQMAAAPQWLQNKDAKWATVVANMASYAICSEFDFGDSWQHDHWD